MPAADNLYKRRNTYYARFAVNGRLQRRSLRTGDLREAKVRLKGLRTQAERGLFGIQEAPTWQAAVIAYSAGALDSGTVKPGTAERYRVSLRQLESTFKDKRLPTLTVQDVARYVASRQSEGATNATIRRDLTTLSRVLAFARSQGMCEKNVAEAYDRDLIRERRAPILAPPDEVIEAGARVAERAGDRQLASLIRFLRATGMRSGEALRARWDDLHEGGSLTIMETKNGRARTIRVPPAVLPAGPRQGRLFPDLPTQSDALASHWQWIRRGLPNAQWFRLHDLRHAYGIAEIRAGRDIYDLSHHMGHSSVKVTEIYLGYAAGHRARPRDEVPRAGDTNEDTMAA